MPKLIERERLPNGHERICMLLKAQAVLQEIHLVLTAFLPPNC